MPISNVDLIRDSLSLIKVLRVGASAEIEHSALGLRKLNALLAEWEANGVNLQYYSQTIDQLGNTCPIPDDAQLAVTYYLGFALAPHYGKEIDPAMMALGQKYYDRLTRESVNEKLKEARLNLPRGEGQSCVSTILDG